MFIFTCPHCKTQFQSEEEWIGQNTLCPHCQQEIIITRKNLLGEKKKLILGIGIPIIILLLIMCSSGIYFVWEDNNIMESYARRFRASGDSDLSSVVASSPALYKLTISYVGSFFVGSYRFFNHDYRGLEIKDNKLDRLQEKFYFLYSDRMQEYTPQGYFRVLKANEIFSRL